MSFFVYAALPLAKQLEIIYNIHMKKYVIVLIAGILILIGCVACPMYNVVGLPCPACGIMRAWRLVLSGDAAAAFGMHPLFLLPAVMLVPKCRKKWVLIALVAAFLAVYIIRMIFLFPSVEPMNINYDSVIGGFLR